MRRWKEKHVCLWLCLWMFAPPCLFFGAHLECQRKVTCHLETNEGKLSEAAEGALGCAGSEQLPPKFILIEMGRLCCCRSFVCFFRVLVFACSHCCMRALVLFVHSNCDQFLTLHMRWGSLSVSVKVTTNTHGCNFVYLCSFFCVSGWTLLRYSSLFCMDIELAVSAGWAGICLFFLS